MRFLVDNALSPALAAILRQNGHEASHVRDHGLQHADDGTIFDAAVRQEAVVVSADTDFGTLLALRASTRPSVMLFRGSGSRRPEQLAATILANLSRIEDAIAGGCIVTFEPARLRVRALPIASDRSQP
jgi:predicted nuclease of predicted toxin-antitoxin system